MPKLFTRILTLRVQGEIYDTNTKPEEILRNYDWRCHENPIDSNEYEVIGKHKDQRGRITSVTMLPYIRKDSKKPDSEYFLI